MSPNQNAYLQSLVRVDIRKKERSLAKWTVRPGQPAEEAEEGQQKIVSKIALAKSTLAYLKVCR